MSIQDELQNTDFSHLSKIKTSLKTRLHDIRQQKRELSWDELDGLAAAGGQNPVNPLMPKKPL
ncbi:hypothetical protein [uncultured Anaerovibrio sp.]|uniref:hypothetical protein n=1 Tax=uncultured Anaerovibrio sp. TaxID=361586 RepID=UPI00261EA192|nr:hypothetical protein [uncultured Anaerovibrio sp.]